MDLVQIYRAENRIEAEVVKGRLDNEGIKSAITVDFRDSSMSGLFSATYGATDNLPHFISVADKDVEGAKKILGEGPRWIESRQAKRRQMLFWELFALTVLRVPLLIIIGIVLVLILFGVFK